MLHVAIGNFVTKITMASCSHLNSLQVTGIIAYDDYREIWSDCIKAFDRKCEMFVWRKCDNLHVEIWSIYMHGNLKWTCMKFELLGYKESLHFHFKEIKGLLQIGNYSFIPCGWLR